MVGRCPKCQRAYASAWWKRNVGAEYRRAQWKDPVWVSFVIAWLGFYYWLRQAVPYPYYLAWLFLLVAAAWWREERDFQIEGADSTMTTHATAQRH